MPLLLDMFAADVFTTRELTNALEFVDYLPMVEDRYVSWETHRLMTTGFQIEARDSLLTLIPTSARGSAPESRPEEKRRMIDFHTFRIATSAEVNSEEIQNVRQFGTDSLQTMQTLVMERMIKQRRDIEYTWTNMRLGCLQGAMIDSDGSVLDSAFTKFGVSQQSTVEFALGTATTDVRGKCHAVRRAMQREAKGAWVAGTSVTAFVGDDFFDALINHAEVKATYNNWEAAADLRQDREFRDFTFGGITFVNWRGSDPDTIDADAGQLVIEAKSGFAFPTNAPGVFQQYWGPMEGFDWVNRPGQPVVALPLRDEDRGWWFKVELYSHPFFLCTRPRMLFPLVRNTTGSP